MKLSKVFITVICCMMLSSFFGCSEAGNAEDASNVVTQVNDDSSSANVPEFAVNESGQTYGGVPDLEPESYNYNMPAKEFYETYWPDLVSVRATNGKDGYVYRDELIIVPANPEEAAKLDQSEKEPLTVYESDGRTVVGIWEQN